MSKRIDFGLLMGLGTVGGSMASLAGASASMLMKRDSSSNLPLPMHLISAKNEQKAAVAMATNPPVRQQLPMKLAKLASAGGGGGGGGGGAGGGGGGPTATSPTPASPASTAGAGVQQMLPLRLSENLEHRRGSPGGASMGRPVISNDVFFSFFFFFFLIQYGCGG